MCCKTLYLWCFMTRGGHPSHCYGNPLLPVSLSCSNTRGFVCLFPGCNIVSVTSPSASTLNVVWSSYSGASVYLLDFRVVNSTSIAPVVVMQSAPSTQRLIQGLIPGHVYQVTMKVFQFYTVVCTDVEQAITGKGTLSFF